MKNNISSCTVINVAKINVAQHIYDFRNWLAWSPFHAADPESTNTFSDEKDGLPTRMDWEGKISGLGFMTIEKKEDNDIYYHLEFLKPFKSKAKSSFHFKELEEGKTEVTWNMQGHLPFFLFFMKKLFNKMLTNDFQRGLKRLKSVAETGKVPAKIVYNDTPQLQEGFNLYYERATDVHITGLPNVMEPMMNRVFSEVAQLEGVKMGLGYSLYEKSNFLKDTFTFKSGVAVEGDVKGDKILQIPQHKAIKVTLTGPYEYLEDAWAGVMMHVRALKFKVDKKIPPYEKYVTDPQEVKNPENYITEVIIPVK